MTAQRPTNLKQLRESGWQPKSVKHELRDNYLAALKRGDALFPGIVGYDDTVIPEISIAVLAAHDILFLGEKGQAKSRLMRSLVRFLDEYVPYLDIPGSPIHEDPFHPITRAAKDYLANTPEEEVRVAWWHRDQQLRGAARPRYEVRRRDWRNRPGEARRRNEHVGRRRPALRTHPANAPRHLRDERNPRAGRTHSSRAVQHPRRTRRADSRLPDSVRSRRADSFQREPVHV